MHTPVTFLYSILPVASRDKAIFTKGYIFLLEGDRNLG